MEPILSIHGTAADHLYREGSAKATFWETIFGSSLRAKRRTRVSSREDGTREFDVPLFEVADSLLGRAESWMSAPERAETCREALGLLGSRGLRVALIGLQPRGQAVASFALHIEPARPESGVSAAVAEAFRQWFAANGEGVAREHLIPFGFTPQSPEAPGGAAKQ